MKKIIAMLLAVMMLASLGTAAFAEDKVTVEVIAAQYGTKTADWWVGFEEKFEAANADIDLVVEVVSWNDINTVVDTRIANGQQPDLLNIDAYMKYYESELLLPALDWCS